MAAIEQKNSSREKDVQVGLDAKELVFEEEAALASFLLSSLEKKVSLLLQLQLNGRRWCYQIVVTLDHI